MPMCARPTVAALDEVEPDRLRAAAQRLRGEALVPGWLGAGRFRGTREPHC